ncbi:MAG: efflux RND transporter periplasmic adaptor subunit [Candidatus Melainabacteria bacterium]|nr:efflux RND transporter periplasmic adaptor subunit [Candidatus Melainabacteria bacterium]
MAEIDSRPETVDIDQPQRLGFFGLLRKNFWGLVTLIVVIVVCVSIVQMFKKPGQMSVIESQAMDMAAMVPPKGAVPVGIAKVERRPISSSVTYTGSVQAYTDEDVYPRVTGQVVAIPVYAGDRVRKGQLLIQLDPANNSEYSTKREEAENAEDAAQHNAGIAKSEFAQKKYQLQASKEAEQAALKAVEEADANLSYWKPEVARQSALLKAQVVSLDEYQKEAAELRVAQAKLDQSQAKLRESKNTRLAAQSELDTMIHHVGHQYSAAKQAQSVLKNARINESYTRILAQDDGVVTKRAISPGVVVSPGMLLLKIAHIKQVRIQAEVATEDAENIHLGDKVYIKGSENSKNELIAAITSIFPAADASSRTFTVEALIDNVLPGRNPRAKQVGTVGQYKFLPGQYIIMRILTGKSDGPTVPTSAIVWREGKAQVWRSTASATTGGATEYTCTMHPEVISDKPGKCPKCGMPLVPKEVGGKQVATLVDVEVGLSNPERTEILKGLREGDEVVYAGYADLQPGMSVVKAEWGKTGPVNLPTASEVQGNRLDSTNNWTHEEMSGVLMLKVALKPAKGGSNTVVVTLEKHGGGSVSGARVSVKTSMPGMNMPGPVVSGTTGINGETQMKTDLMSGLWQLDLTVTAPGEAPVESTLDLDVP